MSWRIWSNIIRCHGLSDQEKSVLPLIAQSAACLQQLLTLLPFPLPKVEKSQACKTFKPNFTRLLKNLYWTKLIKSILLENKGWQLYQISQVYAFHFQLACSLILLSHPANILRRIYPSYPWHFPTMPLPLLSLGLHRFFPPTGMNQTLQSHLSWLTITDIYKLGLIMCGV